MNVRTHNSIKKAIAAVTDWNNLPLAENVQITEGERASLGYISITATIRDKQKEFKLFFVPNYWGAVWVRVYWDSAGTYYSNDLSRSQKKYTPSAQCVYGKSVRSLIDGIRTYRSAADAARAAIKSFA